MSSFAAYGLGLLTVLLILIPFYLLARASAGFGRTWRGAFCTGIAS